MGLLKVTDFRKIEWTCYSPLQLESVAKISNLECIDMLQYIECFNILKCFNVLCPQYIEAYQYIANYLFLQRTLTVNFLTVDVELLVVRPSGERQLQFFFLSQTNLNLN